MSELEWQLLDAKLLLEHGITHMKDTTRIGKLLAIHHAHEAVELSMRIRAEQFKENPYSYADIKKALKGHDVNIPYEHTMDELNKTRTLAQHYGQPPEDSTAIKLVSVAKEFLIEFWQKEFFINYDDVSLATLISNQQIREIIEKANELLEKEDFDGAVEQAVLAIYRTTWELERKFTPPSVVDNRLPQPFGQFDRWRDYTWVVLSIPYASKLRKLLDITGIRYFTATAMQKMKDYKATKDDAYFAVSLCLEYALWVEQTYF
jgi:hypothetical protein